MGRLLNQILKLDNLAAAWEEVVDADAGPGRDGVTLEEFARHWEANLVEIRQAVKSGYYKPDPLQRFTIPKKDGSPRLLGNLTVRDKVLQRAALRLLDDIYEPFFLECSFAYRPKRSIHGAVEQLVLARDLGRLWVLDADIDDFFHSLDHELLLRFLRENLTDEALLRLIRLWLDQGRPAPDRAVGTPLGAIISPLMSNIYLHYLDLVMTHTLPRWGPARADFAGRGGEGRGRETGPSGPSWAGDSWDRSLTAPHSAGAGLPSRPPDWVYLRYADDTVVLCRSREQAEAALALMRDTLATLRLRLEPTKTAITTFHQGFDYLGYTFQGYQFYFEREGKRIIVDDEGSWELFYQYGPTGYE